MHQLQSLWCKALQGWEPPWCAIEDTDPWPSAIDHWPLHWVISHNLHMFPKCPLDELVPDKGALKNVEGELVTLSEAEDGLDIKKRQQCLDQFRNSPEFSFCFGLATWHFAVCLCQAPPCFQHSAYSTGQELLRCLLSEQGSLRTVFPGFPVNNFPGLCSYLLVSDDTKIFLAEGTAPALSLHCSLVNRVSNYTETSNRWPTKCLPRINCTPQKSYAPNWANAYDTKLCYNTTLHNHIFLSFHRSS